MQLVEDTHEGQYQLKAYDSNTGELKINQEIYTQPVILGAELLISEDLPAQVQDLNESHIASLLAQQPELILVGSGKNIIPASPSLIQQCYAARVGIEVMTTDAACRTLSLLLAEHRFAFAVLFP